MTNPPARIRATLATALHYAFTPDHLHQLHRDAVTVQDTVTNTGPWQQLVAALDTAAHPLDGELDSVAVDLGYLDELTAERDRLRAQLAAIRDLAQHLNTPMLNRLRQCAQRTGDGNWREMTVYTPEAEELIPLIDLIAQDQPAEGDASSVPSPRAQEGLAGWVVELVRGLIEYEATHPTLWAQYAGSTEYRKADCAASLLELVPRELHDELGGDALPEVTGRTCRDEAADRPAPSQGTNTEETAEAAAARFARELEQARRDLLNERAEHRQTSAAEDEARERAEELGTALTIANRALKALAADSRYGIALDSYLAGRLVVHGFTDRDSAMDTGRVLADALAQHQGVRVDATLIEPAKLGDPPVVDVQALLEETRTALAAAVDDVERIEAVEGLLEAWYMAWPETALTSPHWPIAGELIRLLCPTPIAPETSRHAFRELTARLAEARADADLLRAELHAALGKAPEERPVDLADQAPHTDVWAALAQRTTPNTTAQGATTA